MFSCGCVAREVRHNRKLGIYLRQEKGPLRPSTLSICDAGTGTSSMKMDPAAVLSLSVRKHMASVLRDGKRTDRGTEGRLVLDRGGGQALHALQREREHTR